MARFLSVLSFLMLVAGAFGANPLPATAQIRNVEFDRLLRPIDASTKVGAPIILYPAQPWKCMTWKIQVDGAECHLVNIFSNKPFVADESDTLHQAAPDAKSGWKFVANDDGTYRIIDASGEKVLTATDVDRVILSEWKGKDSQKWRIEKKALSELTM